MLLPQGGVPWKEHLFAIEKEQKVIYTIFTDTNGTWRVQVSVENEFFRSFQCVPVQSGSFENRHGLFEPWRGVRDEQLASKVDQSN